MTPEKDLTVFVFQQGPDGAENVQYITTEDSSLDQFGRYSCIRVAKVTAEEWRQVDEALENGIVLRTIISRLRSIRTIQWRVLGKS